MDTSDLRSEEDPSEAHYLRNEKDQEGHNSASNGVNGDGYDSPFIPHNMMMGDEHDQNSMVDDASVEESSGISAAPPGRIPTSLLLEQTGTRAQEQRSFEKLSARRSSGNESLSRSASQSKERSKTLREFENKISPQTEKRWSMAEVEGMFFVHNKLFKHYLSSC